MKLTIKPLIQRVLPLSENSAFDLVEVNYLIWHIIDDEYLLNIQSDNDREYQQRLRDILPDLLCLRDAITQYYSNQRYTIWHEDINRVVKFVVDEIKRMETEIMTKRNYRAAQKTLIATLIAVCVAILSILL